MDVHKRLGGVPVLNGLNVAIPDDTITVVLGPSGTGKSVLIKHLIGLMFPDSGDIVVQGQSVPEPDDAQAAGDCAARSGCCSRTAPCSGRCRCSTTSPSRCASTPTSPRRRSQRLVSQRLTDVGLADAMDDLPTQLSGGMRKRAGFARALVMEPDIVIFDEPDSGLDPVRTALLCELIQEMHAHLRGHVHRRHPQHRLGAADRRVHRAAVEGQDRGGGRCRANVLLGECVRAPVPQRLRRGPADDGLSGRWIS